MKSDEKPTDAMEKREAASRKPKVRGSLRIRPEDTKNLDPTSKAMVYATHLMEKDSKLSAKEANHLAIQMVNETDRGLIKTKKEEERGNLAVKGGIAFTLVDLTVIGIAAYLGLPATIILALIGLIPLVFVLTLIPIRSKLSGKEAQGLIDSIKGNKSNSTVNDEEEEN